MDITRDPFAEYLRAAEPDAKQRGQHWQAAIGLQAVDGLQPSQYLLDTAKRNIDGEITVEEAGRLIHTYYESRETRPGDRTEEADKVSAHIAALLAEPGFSFTPGEYIATHRRLFEGVYAHAGQLRTYNITKKEWVLDGATVIYGSADELRPTLEYDFSREREFSYKGLSMSEIIAHLARFVADLWQIHCFGEGNTRTTAVFFIRYLRMLGFPVGNELFAENSWYFRNALVRANYTDLGKGIHETTEPLERFLENLLAGADHPLKNRTLHLRWNEMLNMEFTKPDIQPQKPDIGDQKADIQPQKPDIGEQKADIQPQKSDIGDQKADIQPQKPDIGDQKADIQPQKPDIGDTKADIQPQKSDIGEQKPDIALPDWPGQDGLSEKTLIHVRALYEQLGNAEYFGRSDAEQATGLRSSRTSELLRALTEKGILEPVQGHGKGKLRFSSGAK